MSRIAVTSMQRISFVSTLVNILNDNILELFQNPIKVKIFWDI